MSEHTPGPWILHDDLDFIYVIHPSRKYNVFDVAVQNPNNIATNEEMVANANLIAAAPELYEALQRMEWDHKGQCRNCRGFADVDGHSLNCSVGYALRKAKGK